MTEHGSANINNYQIRSKETYIRDINKFKKIKALLNNTFLFFSFIYGSLFLFSLYKIFYTALFINLNLSLFIYSPNSILIDKKF